MSRNPLFNALVDRSAVLAATYIAESENAHLLEKSIYDDSTKMIQIYESKDADYSSDGKPMGNLRTSEMFGIPAYKGVLMRMGDKCQRVQSFIKQGILQVKEETVSDTLLDLANYAILGCILRDECSSESPSPVHHLYIALAARALATKALYANMTHVENDSEWNAQWQLAYEIFIALAADAKNDLTSTV